MTESRDHRILLDLQDALQAIGGSGYHLQVDDANVSIDPLDIVKIVTGRLDKSPFFVIERATEGRPDYYHALQMRERIPFDIVAFATAVQGDPVSRVLTYDRLCADIEKAVTADIKRGELATDTRIVSRTMQVTTGSQRVVAVVALEVRVYRTYGDPNAP